MFAKTTEKSGIMLSIRIIIIHFNVANSVNIFLKFLEQLEALS